MRVHTNRGDCNFVVSVPAAIKLFRPRPTRVSPVPSFAIFSYEECSMATPVPSREINEDKMHQFLGKVVGDFGASLSSSLAYIGQKLGLYKALAADGPLNAAELAQKTNTNERYVRE